ncbi:hypothetical protein [Komagataeibacter oboediens]|uniref:hypothetical protein n=1 Tax=Komagataeibacter oboediens TaxID=65958 RepID=UPI0011B598AD|nr:hypothetical protein [Komagataeibacter oboediens]
MTDIFIKTAPAPLPGLDIYQDMGRTGTAPGGRKSVMTDPCATDETVRKKTIGKTGRSLGYRLFQKGDVFRHFLKKHQQHLPYDCWIFSGRVLQTLPDAV